VSKKKFTYYDLRVEDKKGSTFYLRHKVDKYRYAVITVRTQKKGKGKCVARVQGLDVTDENRQRVLYLRLVKKWRQFWFVTLTHVNEVLYE